MDVKQLNYFVQIAKYGSYSLASQKLYISQPALSKVIKNMEEEMDLPSSILIRENRSLQMQDRPFMKRLSDF